MSTVKKGKAGRKPVDRGNRVELKRHQASTTLRISDEALALLRKVAGKREEALADTVEQAIKRLAQAEKVKVVADRRTALGWR